MVPAIFEMDFSVTGSQNQEKVQLSVGYGQWTHCITQEIQKVMGPGDVRNEGLGLRCAQLACLRDALLYF